MRFPEAVAGTGLFTASRKARVFSEIVRQVFSSISFSGDCKKSTISIRVNDFLNMYPLAEKTPR
jgi:hypothetical protein